MSSFTAVSGTTEKANLMWKTLHGQSIYICSMSQSKDEKDEKVYVFL